MKQCAECDTYINPLETYCIRHRFELSDDETHQEEYYADNHSALDAVTDVERYR